MTLLETVVILPSLTLICGPSLICLKLVPPLFTHRAVEEPPSSFSDRWKISEKERDGYREYLRPLQELEVSGADVSGVDDPIVR